MKRKVIRKQNELAARLISIDKEREAIIAELEDIGLTDFSRHRNTPDNTLLILRQYPQCRETEPTSLAEEFADFSSFPENSLVFLLEDEFQNLCRAFHLTINRRGDTLNFCISGQVSLDDLQKMCEHRALETSPLEKL